MSYSAQCTDVSQKARENKELKKYANGMPKGTKLVPVVSLVFYIGAEKWDGPRSLYEMLDIPDNMKGWAMQTMPDYKINLIDARHMGDEEIERFQDDLKAFLIMLKERYDEEKLKSVVARHRETWYALSKIKNDKRYAEYIDSVSDEELSGGVNMDATLDYIEARGKIKGKEEGRMEGRMEGTDRVNKLGVALTKEGRVDEFLRSLSDADLQKELFAEFGLGNGKEQAGIGSITE